MKTPLTILLLLGTVYLSGQSCLPEGIVFTRQSQVDSFRIQYPGCTIIEGYVTILFSEDISSLDSLDHIEIIAGGFAIPNHVASTSDTFDGFPNLKEIHGDVSFDHDISHIDGFNNLQHIEGTLELQNLDYLDGFGQLEYINGNLFLRDLDLPDSFDFFPRLKSVNETLSIRFMAMDTIAGFDSLRFVGKDLILTQLSNVNALAAFAQLTTIGQELTISNLSNSETLDQFSSLQECGSIVIALCQMDSLLGFTSLDSLQGDLRIYSNPKLKLIKAFNELTYIRGNLTFSSNDSLQQILGLGKVIDVLGDFTITGHEALDSISPLSALQSLPQTLLISRLASITAIDFFPALAEVNTLIIQDNINLQTLEGLHLLSRINYDLTIAHQPRLRDLQGLEGLQYVQRLMTIQNCDSLTSLHGIEQLDTIGSSLIIIGNEIINDLSQIVGKTILYSGLQIESNPNLTTFPHVGAYRSVSHTFRNNDKLISISGTSAPFISDLTIKDNDELKDLHFPVPRMADVSISNNPKLTTLAGFASVTYMASLVISESAGLSNLSGLNSLDSVRWSIRISSNPNLINFQGLHALRIIAENDLSVFDNPLLESFDGLSNLKGCRLTITKNHRLKNLSGLTAMKDLRGIRLIENDSFTNLEGLPTLQTLGYIEVRDNPSFTGFAGIAGVDKMGGLSLRNNISLSTINGLENIKDLEGALQITYSNRLKDLSGLDNVENIGALTIIANDSMTTFSGLGKVRRVLGDVHIVDNAVLQDITAIAGGDFSSGNQDELDLRQNPKLSQCAIASICYYFVNSNRHTIDSNAVGCNSVPEVEQQCLTGTATHPFESLALYPNPANSEIFISNESFEMHNTAFTIMDHTGRIFSKGSWTGSADVERLPQGIYTLLLQTANTTHRGRFTKH